MHLLNGDTLSKKIADPAGRVEQLAKAKAALVAMIEELYLVTLSRPPSPQETAKAQQWIADASNLREGAQDLLWALLNSREFLFNH
jgi:hypothetical protein